ncbi:hypothetical protein GCM10018952_40040 [Streptosporangium vulgare]
MHASVLSLPAASAYTTPEAMELETAVSSVVLALPPRLMLATAGLTALAVTQSTPSMMIEVEVLLPQPNTRTPISVTALAMPY